jgi:hypothetical protein
MKKLISILIVGLFLNGCDIIEEAPPPSIEETHGRQIIVIDSCEYIQYNCGGGTTRVYSLTHKGNCKYCTQRNNPPITFYAPDTTTPPKLIKRKIEIDSLGNQYYIETIK